MNKGYNDIPEPLNEKRVSKIALPEWLENMSNDDDAYIHDPQDQRPQQRQQTTEFVFDNAGWSDSSMADSVSDFASEQHSYVNKSRPRGRGTTAPASRRGRRQQQQQDSDGSQAIEDNDGDVVEPVTKEAKLEFLIGYKGKDLGLSKVLGGDYIKTGKKQRDIIDRFNNMDIEDDGDDEKDSERRRNKASVFEDLLDCENDLDSSQFIRERSQGDEDDGGSEDEAKIRQNIIKHSNCALCKHTSVKFEDMNPDFCDAYKEITNLDREKVCYANDPVIFNQMAIMFNTTMRFLKKNGHYHFFVTPEEIMLHFKYHDTSNALRPLNELLQETREIRRRGRKYLFGKANGKFDFWNTPKSKLYLQFARQEMMLINNIAVMRGQMLANNNKEDISKPSRHMAGASKKGKFSLDFSK